MNMNEFSHENKYVFLRELEVFSHFYMFLEN